MNAIATKFQVTTAAFAVAAAATLVPVAAQAAPNITMPTAPITQVLDRLSEAPATIADANWWFLPLPVFGSSNVNPSIPPGVTLLSIDIPLLTPLVIAPVLGFLGLLNTQIICLPGLIGLKTNSYGVISLSVGGC
jgi:hypothetical protein